MSAKDRHGYGVTVGCFVKVEREHHGFKGWVTELDEKTVWVRCAARAGAPRPVKTEEVVVLRPSGIDKARAVGHVRRQEDAGKQARRARGLGPRRTE